MLCRVFYDSSLSEHGTFNKTYTGEEGNTPVVYIWAYVYRRKRIAWWLVSCGDVHTESHSAGVDTVQAGWSVVEREQALAELEAMKRFAEKPLNLQ